MHSDNSAYAYRNENCIVQRNLGVPLYYRCTYCDKTSSECLGMQFNLSTGLIIILLLLNPMIGKIGYILTLAISIALLLRLGIIINKENDNLLINHYHLDIKNRELSILLDASNAIASHFDIERILDILSHSIVNTINCTFVKILLATDGGQKAVIKASSSARELDRDHALGYVIEIMPGSPLSPVLTASDPIVLNSNQIQEICKGKLMNHDMLGCSAEVNSVLVAPIRIQGEYLGMIIIGESRRSERTDSKPRASISAKSLVKHASMAAGIAIKNAQHYQLLHKAHLEAIMCLAETLETRDAYTRGHSDRTVEHATALARVLRLTHDQEERLKYTAVLHDIGKIGIPDSILNKPGKLTNDEYELMKSHPEKGANLASKIRSLDHIAPLIRHHHERWDGGGYPDGISGENIPIESRIVAVLDAYDAMTSDRIYRQSPGQEFAISELIRCSGTQFDPHVVEAFLSVLNTESVEETSEPLRKSS